MKIILASASPRRKALLEKAGLIFEVIPACGEEQICLSEPWEAVMELSAAKAAEVAGSLIKGGLKGSAVIIGADTVVSYKGEVLGKPKDKKDAFRILSMLQGERHKVYTGVTLAVLAEGGVNEHRFYEETEVGMYPMDESEIAWYIGTGEPFDKAGAYGIQGICAMFIKEIHGSYDNVVGLPVARLYREMKKMGLPVWEGPLNTQYKKEEREYGDV